MAQTAGPANQSTLLPLGKLNAIETKTKVVLTFPKIRRIGRQMHWITNSHNYEK